jgi:hypothetical protein
LQLFAASFGGAVFTATTLFVCAQLPEKAHFGPFIFGLFAYHGD